MNEMVETRALLGPQIQPDQSISKAIKVCHTRLVNALMRLERLVASEAVNRVVALQDDVDQFAVRVSLVGQVKAGKTALTNSLIGAPGLLPSDVNPWTSVVTSININTKKPKGEDAVFTFFKREEWQDMVNIGGHLGEMAVRADSDEEIVELRTQITDMQARTEARLGHNFNLLLDGSHSFLGYTPELVKKYVCLGDDLSEQEGRYADVTKSAALYIDNKSFGLPTIICDTPGVNDPFLLREAVTLDNITDTDVCVVVLSANQAFSSVDISLMRILMALDNDQIVLFVNRVDELQDPDTQIEEIDTYIRNLLVEQSLPSDLPIVFGSAAWADVVADATSDEFESSLPALHDLGQARVARIAQTGSNNVTHPKPGSSDFTRCKQSDLSGLYELKQILEEKGAVSVARPFLERVRQQALDVSEQSLLYFAELGKSRPSVRKDLDSAKFFDQLDEMLAQSTDACTQIAKEFSGKVILMMSNIFREFLAVEKARLKNHLSKHKQLDDWKPDTDTLRRTLNAAHKKFASEAQSRVGKVFTDIATQTEMMYAMLLENDDNMFAVRVPEPLAPKVLVSLMRTMSIDMDTGWFSSWFNKRFNQSTYLNKFEELCIAEMHKTLKDAQNTYVEAYDLQIRAQLYVFLNEHMETLHKLCSLGSETSREEVKKKLGMDTKSLERQAELRSVITDLENLFKRPQSEAHIDVRSVA